MARLKQDPNALTQVYGEEEARQRPLSMGLIARLFRYTGPYARRRNILLATTLTRAAQKPAMFWMIGEIINGPINEQNITHLVIGMAAFFGLATWTGVNFHYRHRLANELGESVVHDLRRDLFAHLQRLTMSYHDRTKRGWLISRMNSDVEYVRMGVQDVLFVSLVQVLQGIVAGICPTTRPRCRSTSR